MQPTPICDFCGRTTTSFEDLELDGDGLWVCQPCKSRLVGRTTVYMDEGCEDEGEEMDARLKPLVGKSAGAICRTLDLPFKPPYQAILEAAQAIAYDEDRYLSAWSFVTQWVDGTTVWRSPERGTKALVSPQGEVRFESLG